MAEPRPEIVRWEEGARAYLNRRPEPADDRDAREGYFRAGMLLMKWGLRPGREGRGYTARLALRLVALWLEHRAAEAGDDASALLTAAGYLRRELLGEDRRPSEGEG